jgi:hypothetical protein
MSEPLQLDLFEDARIHDGRSFGEWIESLPDPADACPMFPDDECRWRPSCAKAGCWRRECEGTGRPLFGIGPSAKGSA